MDFNDLQHQIMMEEKEALNIFIVVVVEMAQITPPIGFNLFVLQGMTNHEMNYLAKVALPMFAMMVVMVFILIAFPDLATYLPDTMRTRPGG